MSEPSSSVPGEPKPEAEGPWKTVEAEDGEYIVKTETTIWDVRKYTKEKAEAVAEGLNDIYLSGRASLMVELESVTHAHHLLTLEYAGVIAELEAARAEKEKWKSLVIRCRPLLHCICDDEERCHNCAGYRMIKEVEAALTPSKENQS
jgi:hypothetical protein